MTLLGRRRMPSRDRGELGRARELVIVSRGAKPELVLRDVLCLAGEGHQPVASRLIVSKQNVPMPSLPVGSVTWWSGGLEDANCRAPLCNGDV